MGKSTCLRAAKERMESRWKDGLESGKSMTMMMEREGMVLEKWLKGESEKQSVKKKRRRKELLRQRERSKV